MVQRQAASLLILLVACSCSERKPLPSAIESVTTEPLGDQVLTQPVAGARARAAFAGGSTMLGDWPNFRGPDFDGISRETGLLKSWPPKGPKVLWKRDLSGGYCSVVLAGGRLFTQAKEGKEEVVLCLDARTGQNLWDFRYPCDYDIPATLDARFKSGPRATPAIDGRHVYTLGTTGDLYCLEVEAGREVWHRNLLEIGQCACPQYGYCNSPLVVDDRLFVHPGGPQGKSLAALRKNDGSVVWTSLDDRIGWATPVMIHFEGTRQLVYFTAEGVVGVAPETGRLIWRHPWITEWTLNVAIPIYSDGRLFISSNYGKGCALLQLKAEGNPDVVWESKVMQNHFSTSILYEGYLYGFSNDFLRCVDFATGKLQWNERGLGRGALVIADGQIMILSQEGALVLADASPKGYVENARGQALEGRCWNVPVLAGGILYARNEQQIVAVEVVNPQSTGGQF